MLNLLTIAACSWIVHATGNYSWGGSIALGVLFWLMGLFITSFINSARD